MSIRCFIAIELGRSIQKGLADIQDRLRGQLHLTDKAIKWVRPENIHLTLKFLGDVDDKIIPEICSAVSEATARIAPFDIEIGDCGCFPRTGSARVLWCGIRTGRQPLESLQEAVEMTLEILGFPPENRKFSAHLTLARIKNSKAGQIAREAVRTVETFQLGREYVETVTVFQSELTRAGPVYTALHHAKLKQYT